MYPNQGNGLMGGGPSVSPNDEQMPLQQSPQHHQQQPQQQQINYNGDHTKQQQQQTNAQISSQQQANTNKKIAKKAYVKIVEQPASKALRFRYECEGRSAGSIPGVNSTPETKTFPTIEIIGYKGRAVVVVSCVTKDAPYRPHPHNLVGKEGCKKGVCTLEINSETMRAVFSNLGIQCVKKKDIESALKAREDIRVDPFKTGFSHRFQPTSIDLNAVRLCFQVFLKGDMGRFTVPLPPVVSEPIYDKKAMSDLVISRICSCSASVLGNTKIILLCEKVAKEDIAVRFFEEKDGATIWQAFGDFEHNDVHKQTAITFRTPRYHKTTITEPVEVYVQLQRPSDGAVSDPVKFEYVPAESGRYSLENLRRTLKRKPDEDIFQEILAAAGQIKPVVVDVIDLNTPTAPPQPEVNHIVEHSISEETEEADKRRKESEIDAIIDEKVRELEIQEQQQNQQQQLQIAPQQEAPFSEPKVEQQSHAQRNIETQPKEVIFPVPDQQRQLSVNDKINEWMKSNDLLEKGSPPPDGAASIASIDEDKVLTALLDEAAELDEIYTRHVLQRDSYNAKLNEVQGVKSKQETQRAPMEAEDSFDDAATYSSLQKAFKNPIDIPLENLMPPTPPASQLAPEDALHYDHVDTFTLSADAAIAALEQCPILPLHQPQQQKGSPPRPKPPKYASPHMHVTAAEEEKLPPLPPKRIRKPDGTVETSNCDTPIIIKRTPDQSPLSKHLPPKPDNASNSNTLPKQKKPGFFSKLFSRRKSKSDLSQNSDIGASSKGTSPNMSREPSIAQFRMNDVSRGSVKSLQPMSLPTSPTKGGANKAEKPNRPVGRSVSSVSGKCPARLTADVIHIPLKGDSVNSLPHNEAYSHASTITLSNTLDRKTVSALQLADIPICEGNMELVAIADRQSLRNLCEGAFNVQLDPDVDLTEAEHYALYTSIPPQATTSEFDEASAYYAAVDAGEILTPDEIGRRLAAANRPDELRRKRQRTDGDSILHASLQQQQKKIQSDHPSSRMTTWNTPNIPAIKTEPREASPQPFAMYRAPSEMTPSPQPLSPSTNYNLPNTPSPYNLATGGNTPLMSPNHQYRGGTPNTEAITTTMDMHNEFVAYGGGHQQQQQKQQQHATQYVRQHQIPPQHVTHQQQELAQHSQQQFHGVLYNNNNNNDMGNWEEKFANVLANSNNTNAAPNIAAPTMNNLNSNNNNNNQLNMQNLLTANATNMVGVTQHSQWHFPPNAMQDAQLQQHHQLQAQQHQTVQTNFQQQHQQSGPNDAGRVDLMRNDVGSDANNVDIPGDAVEQGPTISNLLNFDSGQLVHINSEEQQMLRLTSDELRLSNLSISS
ncbi:embryonic polarity protein dorsal [Eurosta solidaginis]|uniref:embryonic polarity protein dorsal n=1 Tax=Eurosta solidaginis TaxID=178769 RepID=UPI0035307AC7